MNNKHFNIYKNVSLILLFDNYVGLHEKLAGNFGNEDYC